MDEEPAVGGVDGDGARRQRDGLRQHHLGALRGEGRVELDEGRVDGQTGVQDEQGDVHVGHSDLEHQPRDVGGEADGGRQQPAQVGRGLRELAPVGAAEEDLGESNGSDGSERADREELYRRLP